MDCYNYLTYLESSVVDALADILPPSAEDDASLDDPWGEPPGGLRWTERRCRPISDAGA